MTSIPSNIALLAQAELCTAVSIAFAVITVIGWILQLVGGAKQPQGRMGRANRPVRPPQAAGPRPRSDRLRSEIDLFLEEVRGEKPRRQEPRPAAESPILEVVPEEQREIHHISPIHPQPEPTPVIAASPKRGQNKSQQPKPFERKPEVRRGSSQPAAPVEHHLLASVDQSVTDHLGTFTGGSGGLGTAQAARSIGESHFIIETLRKPQGIRQAILLSEIIGKPLARRRSP